MKRRARSLAVVMALFATAAATEPQALFAAPTGSHLGLEQGGNDE